MTRLLIAAGLFTCLGTAPLPAQTPTGAPQPSGGGVPMVYQPEQLNPAQLQAREAVSSLNDSVTAAGGALSRLGVDAQTTSLAVLESRANAVVDRCAAAERQRTQSAAGLSSAPLTAPGELKARKDMLQAMSTLKRSLDLCTATYQPLTKPGKGQEVRDYGSARAKPIIEGLQRFGRSLKPFATEMEIEFRPLLNAGKSPLD